MSACSKHPRYGAKRPPRSNCETCWRAYVAAHPTPASKSVVVPAPSTPARSRGGRCWGCCQENCGYTYCSCSCH